jgi:regulator of sigma E protease
MDILGTIWFCLLAALGFGFVIFIHELGHFLFAKWAGVRVDRFSIGFGPVILRRQIGETEYALSLLPLGGYVKMLGQEDTPTEITGEAKTDPRSYLAKSWKWQSAILLGGVLFNLISSYIILIGIAWYGKPTIAPVVGSVISDIRDERGHPQPSPAAQIGLRVGDRILTINDQPMREFDNIQMAIISSGRDPLVMTVERRDAAGQVQQLRLPAQGAGVAAAPNFDQGRLTYGFGQMEGVEILDTLTYTGQPFADAPKFGERIVAIAGQPVPDYANGQQVRDLLIAHVGTTIPLTLRRGEQERSVTLPFAGLEPDAGLVIGLPVRINKAPPRLDGAAEGMVAGDVVMAVDGVPVAGLQRFLAAIRPSLNAGRPIALRVWRAGSEVDLTIQGRDVHGRALLNAELGPVTGFLPFMPVAFDGKPSPLTVAGIAPGDAIIDQPAMAFDRLLKPFEVAVVSGGQRVLIPLSNEDTVAALRQVRPGLLARVVGSTGTPSLVDELRGKRVTAIEGSVLQLATRDGIAVSLPPRVLSESGWSALAAGLKPGDWITGMVPVPEGYAFEVARGASAPKSVTITPRDPGVVVVLEQVAMTTYQLKSWTEAFSIANDAAYSMVVKTLQIIPKFFQSTKDGGLDPNKALTGPIGIFNMLKGSAERFGFVKYLELMALIGLNLFLVNLLPIPVTDGGQLMFLAIETATGRQLAPWARNLAMYIGLAMVLALMVYVIGLDILRLIGLN